jgi:HEAT repeat protein
MSNEWADQLVFQLRNHLKRESVLKKLVLLGDSAVDSLVSFLLSGPGNEHEPGCFAAEALELIGGEDALNGLFTALLTPIALRDPVEKLQQEAVRDCICHALKRIGDRRAVDPLLLALRKYHLVGAAEALAYFGERRAIYLLVALLEDSFKRARVSEAILQYGCDAAEELMKTVEHKHMKNNSEILPSIERRAEAVKIIGLIRYRQATPELTGLLDDEQEAVKLEAALSLAWIMQDRIPEKAITIINSAVHHPDLKTRLRVEDALCRTKHRNEASR